MGNTAIAELDGYELDELYRLNASETEPEDEDDLDDGEEDDEGIQPEEVPHG